MSSPTHRQASVRRVVALARANALLMARNRLTLVYAVVVPLLPLGLLLAQDLSDPAAGAGALITSLVLVLLFPVYYNLLSVVVTRRDELVLKRLRTGETRDVELVVALALPGAVLAVLISLLTAGIGIAFGLPLPVNALLFLVAVVAGIVMIAALALWTAAWTRNAEAAQLTSGPVLFLMILGQTAVAYPDPVREFFTWTPGTAIVSLVRTGWFGLEPVTGDALSQEATLGFASSWAQAGQPLLVLGAWTAVALWLAARSMRWEPRT
ncbi:ABC transporter permease [Nocardioides sp. AX2bis]|uniref:ABC transporter permease n=1 Tax=Nocardioides sp. AX2bis TaxID=2653157 RepID=UPI0012F3DD74|nr:ABC transporter permease [Nocardioides sp. AX2bis]VXB83724.1 conserved membrane hypothetical protein [Nocardioides sp. AX2bis]